MRRGAKLTFAPGVATAEVTAIAMHHEPLNEAVVGNTVTVTVDAEMSDLRRGMVGSAVDDSPASECCSFLAQVIVLSDPRAGEIRKDSELTVVCHTAQVLCAFQELVSRTDRRTGKVLQTRPLALRGGDAAIVRLKPLSPLCVEPFEEYPTLGRFSVHDQKVTVAVGVVQKVEQSESSVPAAMPRRPPLKGHGSSSPATRSGERSGGKPKPARSEKQAPQEPRVRPRRAGSGEEPLPRGHRVRNFSEDSGEEQRLRNWSADSGEEQATTCAPPTPWKPKAVTVSSYPSPFAAFGAAAVKQERRTRTLARRKGPEEQEATHSPPSGGSGEMSPSSPS
ncbi:unnamed protein product [Symbiodinium natans]|uniref:GTP-eEF1A C-terminal domain-containing protein n=1 Tax=Symbiodinium natans TaxID=878477 RepID=A0A812MMW6_9DINO|nr:unnamed protein product [Symbiodinium natans]